MATHNVLGRKGEDAARFYLMSHGYRLIGRNWRSGPYELDMIARKKEMIIVIEVKTRSGELTDMSEVISQAKEKNLREAVHRYMSSQGEELDCRIDLLFLEKKKEGFNVTHIEDAIGQR